MNSQMNNQNLQELIRDRITDVKKARLGDFIHNPSNWRVHPIEQKEVYEAVLREVGFTGVPLV
jgi:hypothetical protein